MTVTAPVVLPDFTTFSVGATTYQGVWNASTNIPALASGVGVKGQYYVVSVAGTTNLDGHNSWSQYDAAIYNGVNWDIVQGGIVSGEVTTALGFTPLAPSLNLSELASPAVARVNLGIDKRRAVGDASITIAVGDRTVALNVALTAPRVWTLPAASSVSAGQTLYLFDEVGGISATNTLTVTRAGADTINGATTLVFANAYDGCPLMSDGISKWSQDITGLEGGGTGATTAAAARTALGFVAAGPTATYLGYTDGTAKTYTVPAGVKWIRVVMKAAGGGGGGAATGTTATVGTDGGDITFAGLTAKGGKGAPALSSNNSAGGLGGSGTQVGNEKRTAGAPGGWGASSPATNVPFYSSGVGGGGVPGALRGTTAAGADALAGNGRGGGGAFNQLGTNYTGAPGGGEAEIVEFVVSAPAASYAYTILDGGAAGVATTIGGKGSSGFIWIEEHYNL